MHSLQLSSLSGNKFSRTDQSSSSVESLQVDKLPSSFSEWAFEDAHSHCSLDEQMCRLIDNLAVSPHLPGQFCQLDSSMPNSQQNSSESTQSLSDGAHRDRTDSSDSGVISDSADFLIPDQTQVDAILARLEAYFSDEHLRTDTFLLKHIRRSKEGFVSLKLVSSFQKMKSLTKDWRVVAYCICHHSKLLELNETNTKVRRLNLLPEDILQLPITKKKPQSHPNSFSQGELSFESGIQEGEHLLSNSCRSSRINSPGRASCAQFVEDLERRWPCIVFAFEPAGSFQTPSALQNALRTYCERFGQLASIKLLRPEKAVRLDLIRWLLLTRLLDPRRWRQLSALVEFANVEQAQCALESQSSMTGWPGEIQLCSLSMRPMASSTAQASTNFHSSMSPLSSGMSSVSSAVGPSMFAGQSKQDTFTTGRPRNRSDLGALEQLRLDHHYLHSQRHRQLGSSSSISGSATTLSMSGSNSNIAISSGLVDMFGQSPSIFDLNSVRPRASTISHFAGSAFVRRHQLHNPDQKLDATPSTGHKSHESCWPSNNSSNSLLGPIARPKSNSFTVYPQSSASTVRFAETGNGLLGTGNLSSSNLLRLPKGPDVGGIGFDGVSRSRSTSSPSDMMQLFRFP